MTQITIDTKIKLLIEQMIGLQIELENMQSGMTTEELEFAPVLTQLTEHKIVKQIHSLEVAVTALRGC